jgi:membrane protein HdeD
MDGRAGGGAETSNSLGGSVQNAAYRGALLLNGVVSTILGLLVLFDILEATFTLPAVLLGVQALVDGITLILIGGVDLTPSGREG